MNNLQEKYDRLVVYTDGGSRGNPGPGGIGVVIADKEEYKEPLRTVSRFIGEHVTNNEAEYQALIAALDALQNVTVKTVMCYLDSELIVKQLTGEYKVKKSHLRAFYQQIQALSKAIPVLEFKHIPRAENAHADQLVNEALDAYLEQ